MVSNVGKRTNRMGNMNQKASLVASTSFSNIIAGLMSKSEKAQCTFIHRLLQAVDGDVLQAAHKYAQAEIKRRAKCSTSIPGHSSSKL